MTSIRTNLSNLRTLLQTYYSNPSSVQPTNSKHKDNQSTKSPHHKARDHSKNRNNSSKKSPAKTIDDFDDNSSNNSSNFINNISEYSDVQTKKTSTPKRSNQRSPAFRNKIRNRIRSSPPKKIVPKTNYKYIDEDDEDDINQSILNLTST